MNDVSTSRYILGGLTVFSYITVYSLASLLGLKIENALGVPQGLLVVAAIVASSSLCSGRHWKISSTGRCSSSPS